MPLSSTCYKIEKTHSLQLHTTFLLPLVTSFRTTRTTTATMSKQIIPLKRTFCLLPAVSAVFSRVPAKVDDTQNWYQPFYARTPSAPRRLSALKEQLFFPFHLQNKPQPLLSHSKLIYNQPLSSFYLGSWLISDRTLPLAQIGELGIRAESYVKNRHFGLSYCSFKAKYSTYSWKLRHLTLR